MEKNKVTGRFAPTPSGEMHLGNLLCALLAYLSAKKAGGEFIVRIEDLDPLRCPRSSADKIIETLNLFGLESDRSPIFQSERTQIYREKERVLENLGLTYKCFCTRSQLHASVAPALSDGTTVYPGTCRNLSPERVAELSRVRTPCTRIAVPDLTIAFDDGIKGRYEQSLLTESGDFIIRRSDGVYAYQLAVVTDDGESGVTEVFRGDDLIHSTPRQIWLMSLLGYTPPKYYHIPLVCDSLGRKLSKTDGDKIADNLKRLSPERVLGALAYAAGILESDRAAELAELTEKFSANKIKKDVINLPPVLL